MKKIFLAAAFTIAAAASACMASAQTPYTLATRAEAYVPLTGATSLSKGSLWTADSMFTANIGFSFKMAGVPTTKVHMIGGTSAVAALTAVQSGFILMGASLMDRGQMQGVSKSDIRYATSGTTGNRIFKIEVKNAGFEDELDTYGELKDSISMQLWLYEAGNVVEFHYGPSMISHFSDYFPLKMLAGYLKNMDTSTATFEKLYLLNGAPTTAKLDSITNFSSAKGLNAVPPSGTVYRFTPKSSTTTGISQVAAGTLAVVYPTQFKNQLIIEQHGARVLDYTITGMTGQILSQGRLSTGNATLDVSALAAGTYILRLCDFENGMYEGQKIMKL